MKKKFIFDASENDIADISEETVIKDTGVKAEKVKEKVMKEIMLNKGYARITRKKTIISLIAAAAAIAVIGTVSVGAAGGFSDSFGEFFAGKPAEGVFSGGNVSISSDKVNVEFKGIAGDDNQVAAMMKLTNKDGSAFVDTTENVFLDEYDYADNSYPVNNKLTIETNLWDNIFAKGQPCTGVAEYSFDDKNTINMLVTCTSDSGTGLKGHRLTINSETIYAYKKVRTLYVPKDGDGYTSLVNEGGSAYLKTDDSVLEKMYEKYSSSLKENEVIRFNNTDSSVIVARQTKLTLDLNAGVTLNYKSTARSIDSAANREYTINDSKWNVDFINAKSFTIEMSAHTYDLDLSREFDFEDMVNWDEETTKKYEAYCESFYPRELTVRLSDGRIFKAGSRTIGLNSSSEIGVNYGNVKVTLEYTDEKGNSAALDPEDIVSITFEGQELM